jgi:DNA-directed RNA polymerase subunit K/omega
MTIQARSDMAVSLRSRYALRLAREFDADIPLEEHTDPVDDAVRERKTDKLPRLRNR